MELFLWTVLSILTYAKATENSDLIAMESACNNLQDGLQYIKPSENGNIIPVICNDGYTIIDISLNLDVIKPYFSSFHTAYSFFDRESSVYGTECEDTSSWKSFWTPINGETASYKVSRGCYECESSDIYGDNVGYYMSNFYHCHNKQHWNLCDESLNDFSYNADNLATSMCNICDDTDLLCGDGVTWCDCHSLQLSVDVETYPDHNKCVHPDKLLVRPSLIDDRSGCQCYKPSNDDINTYQLSDNDLDNLPSINNEYKDELTANLQYIDDLIKWDEDEEENLDCSIKYYLNNDDFKYGTLQISECGEYVLTEDIIINFNPPQDDDYDDEYWSPNAYDLDELHWYPSTLQADEDHGDYPGLNTFGGYYHLGFFAAISIQTGYVTVNLNDFSLSMHPTYYLQQRFFSLIELGDRIFVTDQGPADFGRDVFEAAHHTTIKDGELGLSSHQGIHGNRANYLTISNVKVSDFDIAGIQCNGCSNVEITNCVVGPQNIDIPVLGRYVHARALIPRLRYFVDEYGDEIVPFGDNPNNDKTDKTVRELADELVDQMDMIYFHVIDGKQYDDDNEQWIAAKKLFLNPTGWLDGGSSYGILLNAPGTAVVAIGFRTGLAENILIDNVEILGISSAPIEGYWAKPTGLAPVRGLFFDTIDWKNIWDENFHYIGDAYTDIVFAVDEIMSETASFCFLNTLSVFPVRDWVFKDDMDQLQAITFQCGSDIQSHDAKGSMGLRMDNVQQFTVSNLFIHDIKNWAGLGDEETCGEYEVIQFLDRADQIIEPGYIATRAQGIIVDYGSGSFENIKISKVESNYGSATGISIYKGSTIDYIQNAQIVAIHAGKKIKEPEKLKLPNMIPYACHIQIASDLEDDKYPLNIDMSLIKNIYALDITGHETCEYYYSSSSYIVPNSCLGTDAGRKAKKKKKYPDVLDMQVKLMADTESTTYPVLSVKCSNEYMIIDINKDENWLKYFSSQRLYHYALLGPERNDHANWQEWLVSDTSYSMLVSPDCQTCNETFELNQVYPKASAYYMTPIAAGCTQLPVGRIACDMDWHTYECRVCETTNYRDDGYWTSHRVYNGLNDAAQCLHFVDEVAKQDWAKYGLCGFTIRDANAVHDASTDTLEHCKTVTHEDVEDEVILPRRKPSIGTDGRFCVCIKPENEEDLSYFFIDENEEEEGLQAHVQEQENEENEEIDVVELYQKDFKYGTYRISEPGTYKIMEDIIFDFNAPDNYLDGNLETYNGETDWWPTSDQIDDYPGSASLRGSYFLGFWAGITVEGNGVTLDLNNHKLAMSEAFYYQQSFFALISLCSQIFLPGQGPGFFGADPVSAQNAIIKNGELGLSSHHGIQGNFNKNILIENVKIYDFKTHGIQFNGFDLITIRNVDVGPNRMIDGLTPFYAHLKALLPIYRSMLENEDVVQNECITFVGRDESKCDTMEDLISDNQILLDMAFESVVFNKNWDEYDLSDYKRTLWQNNKNILINSQNTAPTATLYGIFLNYIGSNVIGWYAGSLSTKSTNVIMDNVQIHDLHHNSVENIAFSQGTATASQRILNCLNAPFNAYHIFGEDQVDDISFCNNYYDDNFQDERCINFANTDLKYIGNKITDIQILAFKLMTGYNLNWNYCSAGAADLMSLVNFAIDGTQFVDNTPLLVGSHDAMIHPGKGIIALRFNGVDNVEINDLNIENIHSLTGIGTLLCGPYEDVVSQQEPYMKGFSMNMVNALSFTFSKGVVMSNVNINEIRSNTGLAFGVAVWYETHIKIKGGGNSVKIHNIYAGNELPLTSNSDYTPLSFPNLAPEGCAFRIYDDEIYRAKVEIDDNTGLEIQCIGGYMGCLMIEDHYTQFGNIGECQDPLKITAQTGHQPITQSKTSFISFISLFLVLFVAVISYYYYQKIETKNTIQPGVNDETYPLLL